MCDSVELPQRKVVRIPGYDYSQHNWYYITLCTLHFRCLFGRIIDSQMQLNRLGHLVEQEWHKSFSLRKEVELDYWVLMPNHLHAVVIFHPHELPALPQLPAVTLRAKSLSSFVAGFKGASAKAVNQLRSSVGQPIWQRGFWEHVVRSDEALYGIRQYIVDNPLAWELDKYNPKSRRANR